jgi:uncharacterized membrane protein
MTSQPTTGNGGLSLRTWTLIVWGLYFLSFFSLAITQIIGLIIAYLKRSDAAGTPFESHMIYAIRTFWIGLGIGFFGLILTVVGSGSSSWPGSSSGSSTASPAVPFRPPAASRFLTL